MDKAEIFNGVRPLLFTIAYDMLGSVMDAEDMVQETYLRWQNADTVVDSPKAYLTTTITNLCINHLNSARVRREEYIGPWLPEPIVSQTIKPDEMATLSDAISMAFVVMLENLSPVERAVFLLRKAFDYDYEEISRMVNKDEAACRQIVSRAQQRIHAEKARFKATHEQQQKLTMQFIQTCMTGDMNGLLALLAEDIVMQTDSGGAFINAARKPVKGAKTVATYLLNILKVIPPNMNWQVGLVNGQPGIISYIDGKAFSVISFHIVEGRIQNIYNVMNPTKLKHIPEWKEQTQ